MNSRATVDVTAILGFILKGLASGALGKIGGDSVGYLLSLITGTPPNPPDEFGPILTHLQDLEQQMGVVEQDLNTITAELNAVLTAVNWNADVTRVTDAIEDIKAQYTVLQSLAQDDTQARTTLINWATASVPGYLSSINATAQPGQGGTDPNQQGLIRLYTGYNAQASLADPAYAPTAVLPGSPLAVYYLQAEQYFLYLVGVQLKALTLLVNAYTASGEADLAGTIVKSTQANLVAQGQTFVAAVEAYAVNYAPDLSLTDVIGKAGAFDPISRAGRTVDATTNAVTFYVRLWVGAGTQAASPANPFSTVGGPTLPSFDDTTLSAANGTVPWLTGVGGTASVQADEAAPGVYAAYTAFPPRLGCQWGVLRATWTNPPDGSYQLTVAGAQVTNLFLGGTPVVNTLVQPSNGQYFYDPAADFTFGGPTPANQLRANYVGRTVLGQDQSAGYAGTAAAGPYSPGVYNPGPDDFAVQFRFSIPGAIGSRVVALSSKCVYSTYDDNGNLPPGSTGFTVSLTPDSDGAGGNQALTVRLDLAGTSTANGGFVTAAIAGGFLYPAGTWVLVTAGRSGGQLYLYLNGEPPISLATSGAANQVSLNGCWNLMFGCENVNYDWEDTPTFKPSAQFYGFLAEVSVWHRALSEADVKQIAALGIGPAPAHLYGYWSMADGTANCFSLVTPAPGANLPAPAMTPLVGSYYPKWQVAYRSG